MNDVTITLSSNGDFHISVYMDSKVLSFDSEGFMQTQEAKELHELAKLAFARIPEFVK